MHFSTQMLLYTLILKNASTFSKNSLDFNLFIDLQSVYRLDFPEKKIFLRILS